MSHRRRPGPRAAVPVFAFLTLLLAGIAASADAPDPAAMIARVRRLAAPDFAGRGNGTPEALAAADSIRAWFERAGLAPASAAGWFQDFPLTGEDCAGREGRNVLGLLPGRGDLAGEVVILGAHYDHLGRRDDPAPGEIDHYPGAEDNASGVAVLCELARLLAAGPDPDAGPRRGCLFAAFAGEEIGRQGSLALAEAPRTVGGRVVAMLNLDSVGRLRDSRLYIGGLGTSNVWRPLIGEVAAGHDLVLELSDRDWDASDHVSFAAAGVPVLFLFTGPHPEYHSPADVWDLVPPEGLARVAAFARDLAAALLERPGAPVFTDAASPGPAAARPADGRKRSWLGSIPDFVEGVEGVRLAGTMPGSPAAEAGLAKGDVLVGFAGETVADLEDLTRLLYAHGTGETVTVTVLREGERRDFRITLRDRPR